MTAKKTDLDVLRALLSLPEGTLPLREQRIFREWHDRLATGLAMRLTPKQRMWADSMYESQDLDTRRPPVRTDLAVEHPLDKLPRPEKPPGRG